MADLFANGVVVFGRTLGFEIREMGDGKGKAKIREVFRRVMSYLIGLIPAEALFLFRNSAIFCY